MAFEVVPQAAPRNGGPVVHEGGYAPAPASATNPSASRRSRRMLLILNTTCFTATTTSVEQDGHGAMHHVRTSVPYGDRLPDRVTDDTADCHSPPHRRGLFCRSPSYWTPSGRRTICIHRQVPYAGADWARVRRARRPAARNRRRATRPCPSAPESSGTGRAVTSGEIPAKRTLERADRAVHHRKGIE